MGSEDRLFMPNRGDLLDHVTEEPDDKSECPPIIEPCSYERSQSHCSRSRQLRKLSAVKQRALSISEQRKRSSTFRLDLKNSSTSQRKMRALSTGSPPDQSGLRKASRHFMNEPGLTDSSRASSSDRKIGSSNRLHANMSLEIEFRKLSASCTLTPNGQLPDGVLNLRTSFQSRPSLIALGSKANSVAKFPVYVQTYSSNQADPEDAESDLGERKDSTIIIAPGPEEVPVIRNFDFCQVPVLLSELQLLAGILVFTFAISMQTSPSVQQLYTPHWAGIPLFFSGSLGMALQCRNWSLYCTPRVFRAVQAAFYVLVSISGLVAASAAMLSLTFLSSLAGLDSPKVVTLAADEVVLKGRFGKSDPHVKCVFNQTGGFSHETEFHVANMKTSRDCDNFLFNIKNYSLMQCVILACGAIVSLVIVTTSYIAKLQGTVKKRLCKHHKHSLSLTNSSRHFDQMIELRQRLNTKNESSLAATDTLAVETDNSEYADGPSLNSPATRQTSRYKSPKDGNCSVPGIIVETKDGSTI